MHRTERSARGWIPSAGMAVLFCSDTFWHDHGDDIVSIDPSIEVVRLVEDQHVCAEDLERITIAFFSGDTWPERAGSFLGACTRAPNLEWLQTFSAGTDHPIFGAIRGAGVTVTNSAGSSAPSIAQTVMLYLLALSRDLPRLSRAQSARRWAPGPARDLHDLRLGIVGLGGDRQRGRPAGGGVRHGRDRAPPHRAAATNRARPGRTSGSTTCSGGPMRSWSRRPSRRRPTRHVRRRVRSRRCALAPGS